eukprot:1559036-Pleurochrysis_carterae.AAC.2
MAYDLVRRVAASARTRRWMTSDDTTKMKLAVSKSPFYPNISGHCAPLPFARSILSRHVW